jgi:glucose/arabinose dehydrogenase
MKTKISNLALLFFFSACTTAAPPALTTQALQEVPTQTPFQESTSAVQPVPTGWKVESVAEGLTVPWSIVFTSADRILMTERGGMIREIVSGVLNPEPLMIFDDISPKGESGLMGLAVDPHYTENQYLYTCYTYTGSNGTANRVVRLKDEGDSVVLDTVVLDPLPSANNHAGCRIRFGPDGKLYVTNGDALDPSSAQDLNSLAGKILRINPDGSIPEDNPFRGSPVWSYGHRNPQGLDWQPGSGQMFSTEHGPSGFDGPGGGDEINMIQAGGNYGWPLVSHDEKLEGTIAPIIQFTPAEAPASLSFYTSDVLPMFTGSLFFGALRGEGLVRVVLSDSDPKEIISVEKIISDIGRVRDVVQGPDGFIYFSTSNRDGRGSAREGDDHIYRIAPTY